MHEIEMKVVKKKRLKSVLVVVHQDNPHLDDCTKYLVPLNKEDSDIFNHLSGPGRYCYTEKSLQSLKTVGLLHNIDIRLSIKRRTQ